MNFEDFTRVLNEKWPMDTTFSLYQAYPATIRSAWVSGQTLHITADLRKNEEIVPIGMMTTDDPEDGGIHHKHLTALVGIIRWCRLDTAGLDVTGENAAKIMRDFIVEKIIGSQVIMPVCLVTVV